jgi:predicted permease
VTPEYFRVLGIPLLRGRQFSNQDGEKSEKVIIVSAATAQRYWSGTDPIGKHIRVVWEQEQRTVVGVVGDVRQYDLANTTPSWISGAIYMPYPQSTGLDRQIPSQMNLLVKTVENPSEVSQNLRALVASRNPNVPVGEVRTLESVIEESTTGSRSMMWLFVAFGGVALLLAAIGTYGVISYSVSQRTYEMGVRVALGATRTRIFGMVLEQSLRLVLIGLACGVAISFALTRMLVQFLYGVGATDPWTFLGVAVVLVFTALVAGYVPAWRASRVDPLHALRVD